MVKHTLLKLADTAALAPVLDVLESVESGSRQVLRVLTYHRVDEEDAQPHLSPSILSASPGDFDKQMGLIASRYTATDVQAVLDYLEQGRRLPERAVLVTFDDGYRDFAQHAWGILQKYNIPVVLFVPTAYPGQPQRQLWWDKLYNAVYHTEIGEIESPLGTLRLTTAAERSRVFKRLRDYVKRLPHGEAMELVDHLCDRLHAPPVNDNHIMNWDELRQLAASGVTLAAHTRNHPMLTRISVREAEQEAVNSLEDLQHHVGAVLPVFAYPSGGADEQLARCLAHAGFKLAFTTVRGVNDLSSANPLLLKRINVGRSTSLNILRVQMLPQMVHLNRF
jgi:peptidoglycan/xylan/chitin deacetylase (PgdA/CDA1 family)